MKLLRSAAALKDSYVDILDHLYLFLDLGAAGKIETSTKGTSKNALRKGGPAQRGTSLRKIDLDESSDKSYADQMREALSKNAVRVIDLFRAWDADDSGGIDRAEFHEAMQQLSKQEGMGLAEDELEAFQGTYGGSGDFDDIDTNGDGEVSTEEFDRYTDSLAAADSDGDGSVSAEELARYKSVYGGNGTMASLDSNGDGIISGDDLRRGAAEGDGERLAQLLNASGALADALLLASCGGAAAQFRHTLLGGLYHRLPSCQCGPAAAS